MINRWTLFIIRARWAVIVMTILLVGAAGYGLQYVTLKSDYREFFPADAPYVQDFDRMEETYINSDMILIILKPKQGDLFNREILSFVEELSDRSWELPYISRVDSITNFQYTNAIDDELNVAPLVEDALLLPDEKIAEIKNIALTDDQLVNRLISENGTVTSIMLTVNLPGIEISETEDVAEAVKALTEDLLQANPLMDVYLTGMVIGTYTSINITKSDAVTLMPFMGLIIVIALMLLLRSINGMVATVLVISFTVVSALGLLGWVGGFLSGPSSCAPVIILTIAVADCVHILVSFFFALREGGSKQDAIIASMRINMMPIFLTSLTTAIGFLSMNFSEVPPFIVLGNIVAGGVFIAYLLSITILPAMIAVMPFTPPAQGRTSMNLKIMESLSDFVIKHQKVLLWGLSSTCIILILLIPKNEINDKFAEFFDKSQDFRIATDFASNNLTSINTLEVALISPYDGGVNNIEFLNALEHLGNWLESQPEVEQVMSLADVMKQLNKSMHNNDETWYRLPDSQELAAQYLLLYELSLPFGLDITNQISFSKTQTRLVLTLADITSKEMLQFEKKLSLWLEDNYPELEQYNTSTMLMFANLGVINAISMLKGSILALFIISFIIMIALRSVQLGFVSLISNMVPAGLAFGIWGLLVGQVNIAVSIAIGMTLGIVVDNTVHFLSKYLYARRYVGGKTEVAVAYAFSHVGTALVVCNIVLIAGFMVLVQSDFLLNESMGYFASLTFIMALIIDFFLLPPVLLKIDKAELEPKERRLNARLGS